MSTITGLFAAYRSPISTPASTCTRSGVHRVKVPDPDGDAIVLAEAP